MKKTKNTKLHYMYDKEADVMYFSQGKPSSRAISQEMKDDIVLRLHPKTKQVMGFTILNFNGRSGKKMSSVSLPILAKLVTA